MRTIKPIFLIATVVICLTWLSSCTYSRTFEPELKANQNAIADSINAQYHFTSINVTGKATSGTGGKHTILTLRLTNGQNLPKGDDALKPLAKKLTLEVLESIKDTAQYDEFLIQYNVQKIEGEVTRNDYTGFTFTKAELRAK
jgi:hypothetical protein